MICATIASSNGAKNVKASDYQIKFDTKEEKNYPSQEELEMKFRKWGNMHKAMRS